MRSVVPPDEKRGIGKNTEPFNHSSDLVEMGARALLLEAGAQPSCSRPSEGIFLSEPILFFPLDCGCPTDAQTKVGCDIFVQPLNRPPVPPGTESPVQPGTCLSRVLSGLSESGYENTLVPCSLQPGPPRVRLTTAAATLPVRLTCEVRPTCVLPSRIGKPTRGNNSEARPGSPRPILVGFAPKPAAVWREDNGSW
jgi:hypothetical protein